MDPRLEVSPALESRVLIIMTGGTICMKPSPNGFVPARGFLESGLAPRPSFNDGTYPGDLDVVIDNATSEPHRSLRTPISTYQKHVRFVVFEFPELLDSSSINADGWSQICQTIFRNYKLFDAFVILHGTDSLAYTCSALSFMLQNLGKPVILTGSQVCPTIFRNHQLFDAFVILYGTDSLAYMCPALNFMLQNLGKLFILTDKARHPCWSFRMMPRTICSVL